MLCPALQMGALAYGSAVCTADHIGDGLWTRHHGPRHQRLNGDAAAPWTG